MIEDDEVYPPYPNLLNACPTCGAPPGFACVRKGTRWYRAPELAKPHEDRVVRCAVASKSPHSFMRTWYCSLPVGHRGAHIAYPNNEKPERMSEVCWLGPWADGTDYPSLEDFAAEHGLRVLP